VRIRITFGALGCSSSSLVVASTEGKQPASVKQNASSKREGKRMARAPLPRLLGLPVRFAPFEGLL
jgi:hypothetical protein